MWVQKGKERAEVGLEQKELLCVSVRDEAKPKR